MNPNITAAMLKDRWPNEALERNRGCHAVFGAGWEG
jgi:hypothetical protein